MKVELHVYIDGKCETIIPFNEDTRMDSLDDLITAAVRESSR